MHPCLGVDEILRLIARKLVESEAEATAVSLACCCKCFEDPMLDTLWEGQDQLIPLLKCFPPDAWAERHGKFSFNRFPTEAECTGFQKHARRMQNLTVDTSKDPITPDIFITLKLCTTDEPFLPRLKTFECEEATEAFIDFIPLLLSPKTVEVDIEFVNDSPTMAAASSLITRLPTLCPDLEYIALKGLSSSPIVVDAVSELALTCNRNSLWAFQVECPLTEEAREVVYQLPRLFSLCTAVEGPTSLPTILLPNLTALGVGCEDDLGWLQGFRGANLEKLESIFIQSRVDRIDDFLGVFKSVMLTTSVPNTLSRFSFHTQMSWDPNYRSLLSFRQLEHLEIEFSCNGGCSSRVDDDIVISLAQAMPKLEILRLGGAPCKTPSGVTVDGLIGLASRCPHLSELRVHFDAASLIRAPASAVTRSPSDNEPVARRAECALENLEVGEIAVPERWEPWVASALLRIFPHIHSVTYTNQEWKKVAETIEGFRQTGMFVISIP